MEACVLTGSLPVVAHHVVAQMVLVAELLLAQLARVHFGAGVRLQVRGEAGLL